MIWPRSRWAPCLAACALLAACPGEPPAALPVAPAPPARLVGEASDGSLRVTLPGDVLVHRHVGVVQATTMDGRLRLHVARLPEADLLLLAGPAKDALAALGWVVEGEQHYERAIHVRLRRGGPAREPAERRESWWIARGGAVVLCEGIAVAAAVDRLGERLKRLCQAVELPGEEAPVPAEADAERGGD